MVSTPAPMEEPILAPKAAQLTVRVDTLARDICMSKTEASEAVIELWTGAADRSRLRCLSYLSSHCEKPANKMLVSSAH
jgi:hypothetical protein